MSLEWALLTIGILIVFSLGLYAFYLLRKVKMHKQTLEAKKQEAILEGEQQLRNNQLALIEDIKFLANSVLQEQCEITEGVLRLHFAIKRLDPDLWNSNYLAMVREHYSLVCDMPILDEYKSLTNKERMALDRTRWNLEVKNKDSVADELKWLVQYEFQNITRLH